MSSQQNCFQTETSVRKDKKPRKAQKKSEQEQGSVDEEVKPFTL